MVQQHILTKIEIEFIQGTRQFIKEQAKVIRYRINKKLRASNPDTTNNNVSNVPLGRMFSYGEGTEATVNPMNETYIVVSYSGNRIIIPPNATTGMTINSTETGNVTINIQPNGLSIDQGQALHSD
jgi:hypothetical protein